MKKLLTTLIFCGVAVGVSAGVRIIVPGAQDISNGSSASIDTWYIGGIGGNWFPVGQPNTQNRRDRVIIRFDLSRYIDKGRIGRAVLLFSLEQFGRLRQEELQLDHFTVERQLLTATDLISPQVEKVTGLSLNPKMTQRLNYRLDVTRQVNADLRRGFGMIAFRLLSNSADQFGNPFNAPTGVNVIRETVKLSITE